MPAARLDLTIEQNAAFSLVLRWRSVSGVPIDLTGYTVRSQIRSAPDAAVHADMTVANGGVVLTHAEGKIELVLNAEQTAALDFTTALYDVVAYAPDGKPKRLLEGSVLLSRGITE